MAQLCRGILAYELLAALSALRYRRQRPGDGVAAVMAYFDDLLAPLDRDRSPGPDVEMLLDHFDKPGFVELTR